MREHLTTLYHDQGFIFFEQLISYDEVTLIKTELKNIPAKIKLQDKVTPWGYGNLIDKFNFVLGKEKLKFLNFILGPDYTFNHLLINNKAAFTGPPVEWHQELSLVNTYAAGYTSSDVSSFAQIYIALDDHTDINGCLKIFPGSHKLGLLPHDDIIGYNFNHKKQINRVNLQKLNKTHPVESVIMKAGDCVIFNHLLVHGSGANVSNQDRKSIILQARKETKPIDKELFENYSKFRVEYAVNFFKEKIDRLLENNMYKDFIGYDKKTEK